MVLEIRVDKIYIYLVKSFGIGPDLVGFFVI